MAITAAVCATMMSYVTLWHCEFILVGSKDIFVQLKRLSSMSYSYRSICKRFFMFFIHGTLFTFLTYFIFTTFLF